ncbi:unnamed protein product, partial [Durusdinium trenchii]
AKPKPPLPGSQEDKAQSAMGPVKSEGHDNGNDKSAMEVGDQKPEEVQVVDIDNDTHNKHKDDQETEQNDLEKWWESSSKRKKKKKPNKAWWDQEEAQKEDNANEEGKDKAATDEKVEKDDTPKTSSVVDAAPEAEKQIEKLHPV